jgi:hypothetical protein
MTIRANDSNNDWIYGLGVNAYKKETEEIKQDIKTKLLEWKGDCFFNNEAGIDWLSRFSDSDIERLEQEITSLILKVNNVVNVVNIDFSLENRNFDISYEVQTVYSQTILDGLSI